MLTLAVAFSGVFLVPGGANAVPGFCPPTCDAIPDSAWVEPSSLPLASIYRWPSLPGLAVTAPAPRFEFESWCVTPDSSSDPRRYAVAARATAPNPDGQWNLQVQVIHWRGDTVTGGQTTLEVLEKARIALATCGDGVSPSLTTHEVDRIAAVISETGSRVMRVYLLADPASSTIVEVALWTTLPARVEWRAVPDAQVFETMAAPLCAAYLGSCR
ncbi:ATPase [Mycobacterium kyogaense]|uniref:ATPase n=1 Tax=Mycobacterium kyogaense TaxID=2212479 RepID=UPI002FFD1076